MIRLLCSMAFMITFLVSGCKTMGPEQNTQLPVKIPASFSYQYPASRPLTGPPIREWWTGMGNEELNMLVGRGLDLNYDLKVKLARIDQAVASLEKEKAFLAPGLDFSFGGSRKHTRTKTSSGQGAVSDGSSSWDGGLKGSYTIDLWGEVKAGIQARALELEAARQDYNTVALELAVNIADNWIKIISVRNRREILDSQIKVNTTHLDLQKLRFLNGRASALDVSQQRESLAKALSSVPLLEKEEKQLLNGLAVLIGETPGRPIQISARNFPEFEPGVSPGIPASLLENRSDIRAARVRLLAARSEVEAAKADLLPSFTLSASALFSSGSLDLLFQNWVAALGASLAGPVFDGGQRQAEVERTRAVVREDLNLYAKTVSNAIREVEDSLVGIDRQKAYIDRLEQELGAARLTLKDARVQYLNGQSSYLNYLAAWSGIEKLERQLVSERATLIRERIFFHRAMGWQAPENKNSGVN